MVQDMNSERNGSADKGNSRLWLALLLLALLLAWWGSCEQDANEDHFDVASPTTTTHEAEEKPGPDLRDEEAQLTLGDWQHYPELETDEEWNTEPLDGPRWAQVSAELACAGRSNRGDPEAHRKRVRSIIAYHRTSLAEIGSFSTRLNQGTPADAHLWAKPISEAVRGCR